MDKEFYKDIKYLLDLCNKVDFDDWILIEDQNTNTYKIVSNGWVIARFDTKTDG